MRFISLLCLSIFFFVIHISALAQTNNFFKDVHQRNVVLSPTSQRHIIPQKFRTLSLNVEALHRLLHHAPKATLNRNNQNAPIVSIPLPDGTHIDMRFFESPIMQSGLSANFPMIKTYKAVAADGSNATGWFDYGMHGFHGLIYLPTPARSDDQVGGVEKIYIDPYASNQTKYYISYSTKDYQLSEAQLATYKCEIEEAPLVDTPDTQFSEKNNHQEVALFRSPSEPITLRTYRLALAVTGEYSAFHAINNNPTKAAALSAMVTAINRVNSVLERDIAVSLLLIDETDKVIYLDRFSDPYTNGNTGAMIDENPPTLDTAFTRQGYDIGHVLGTNAGGLAQLQSVCGGGKARGVTCHGNPIGDDFYIDYICHEVGHQFGAGHTFNNCGGNESSGTAYEPGSGSTIMSYSGLCGSNNIQFSSGDYYHVASLEQMIRFSRQNNGNTCGAKTPTNNNTPEVTIPLSDNFHIPISTPFELVGEATDPDGDVLLYNWEQYDLGPIQRPLGTAIQNSPLFRSVNPGTSFNRVFPDLNQILTGGEDLTEVLPDYTRNMTFRLTARDFNGEGGGVDWATIKFKATDTAGPFRVAYPTEENTTLEVGQYVEIKWDVANTNNALVNCQNVNILLSIDGGFTYPVEWVMNTPNDGAEFVLVPESTTGTARVKIEAADNIFFHISEQNFSIIPPTKPGYSLAISSNYEQVCLPTTNTIDIITSSLLEYDSLIELSVVSDLPEGVNINFSKNPIRPSEQAQLQIDMENLTGNQVFDVVVQAIALNADTALRTITLDVVSNDFSSFAMKEPVDGSSGMSGLPTFNWLPAADADAYNIEIATSPVFGTSVVDQTIGVVDTFYQPNITLEENTLYYWRVQPSNRCGAASVATPFAFHTESIDCNTFVSENVPIFISASGTPTVQSIITVSADGEISDLNIPKLKGSHDLVKHLEVKLISPSMDTALLFTDLCGNTTFFDIGFDDEAPTEIPCPPLGQNAHQAQSALSIFDGLSTKGDWILQAEVINSFGEGGGIDEWSIEFCSNISLSNPLLIINDTMPANPGKGRTLTSEFLRTEDEVNNSFELVYTLVRLTPNGQLELNGTPLQIGDQFSQAAINNSELRYIHDGSETPADHFLFTVVDGDGGWTGTHQFNIEVDESFVVSTNEALRVQSVKVFPNPVDDILTITLEEGSTWESSDISIQLFNVQGKLVQEQTMPSHQSTTQLDCSALSAGVYFMKLQIGGERLVKRVVVF